MPRRLTAVLVALAMVSFGVPGAAVAAAGQAMEGQVAGAAYDQGANPVTNHTVRLRSIDTGQLAGTGTTDTAGGFRFIGLQAGHYIVELVDRCGNIVGTSPLLTLGSGTMIASGVIVRISGKPCGTGYIPGNSGSFFTSTAGIVTLAAIGAGVTIGVVKGTHRTNGSPSR